MEFEWDEAKRVSNKRKHGFDFGDVGVVFEGEHLVAPARTVNSEQRSSAIGMTNEVCVMVIFTRRGDAIRIISMRRARDGERRKYQEVFGG